LDGAEGPVGVRDGLALGDLSDEDLSGLAEGDHRGGGPMALGVGDDDGFPSLEDRDHGVGGPQVNSYGFRHGTSLSSCSFCSCSWVLLKGAAEALEALPVRLGDRSCPRNAWTQGRT